MKYLFGPVTSRRLGLSQGIDLIPAKTCNFNCIYCEVGVTTCLTCERREYSPAAEVIAEIDSLLAANPAAEDIDIFTITGSGEPTLHSGIGTIIRHLKARTTKPVAVLTNGSLLHLAEVRADLAAADIVIPSLDAARIESFRRINRPAACVDLEEIIKGLAVFSQEFSGQLWLEVLIARGINDAAEDIAAIQDAVRVINPQRVQLNTVARPPLEAFAEPLGPEQLKAIAAQLAQGFAGQVEILVDFARRQQTGSRPVVTAEILEMVRRRPSTEAEIRTALNFEAQALSQALSGLVAASLLHRLEHSGKIYYQTEKA